jgi:hypothetical protein
MTDPTLLAVYVLGGSIAMIAASLFSLNRALLLAEWPRDERVPVTQATAFILIGWFAAAIALAWVGVYEGASDRLPTIQFGILIPIAIGAVLIWRSETVSRIMDAIPQHWLVGVQVLRGLGAVFLVLYAAGRMPALFALPAGLGDVLVAALALIVAWAYAHRPRLSAVSVAAWNVLGITDLVVAVGTGFATGLSPFQIAAFDNPNTLITAFPLVLIPTYLVPLWIVLHIVSLTKLRRASSRSSPRDAAMASI